MNQHDNSVKLMKPLRFCDSTRVVRLSVIGHSQWLPQGLGTLHRSTFGTRLLPPRTEDRSVPVVVP